MHENRETSESSRLNQSRDRSEKALRRTADRHVSEESDCATVPVNLSNKEEQSSAEMGEGRARTKENIGPSSTSPTQSGKRVSQGRFGVRQAANALTPTSKVEAVCVDAHVRFCAGGAERSASLPRHPDITLFELPALS